jgi:hypothetical protein
MPCDAAPCPAKQCRTVRFHASPSTALQSLTMPYRAVQYHQNILATPSTAMRLKAKHRKANHRRAP